jgi:hypothetical protein
MSTQEQFNEQADQVVAFIAGMLFVIVMEIMVANL